MVRKGHLIAVVVRSFLIGCTVLLVVGCAGTRSETSNKKEQGRSSEATASEEARCEGTMTIKSPKGAGGGVFTTNDIPGCPNGGLLLGTDKPDKLAGKDGDDKIRGLGGKDVIVGGAGDDVIYGGPGGGGSWMAMRARMSSTVGRAETILTEKRERMLSIAGMATTC